MSEVLAVRGSDEVMRELAQATESVKEAKRVLIVGAGSIPRLMAELNTSLADLGYMCVPIEPAQGAYKTFADLLACPTLAAVVRELEPEAIAPAAEALFLVNVAPEPSPPVVLPNVTKLDMSRPINWQPGDVFQDNPRITLPHKRRKWLLDSLDVYDWESLRGDVEIKSPNTSTTELMALDHFMARYVFLERPAVEQSTAE